MKKIINFFNKIIIFVFPDKLLFKNLSIKNKILLSYSIIFFLIILVIGFSFKIINLKNQHIDNNQIQLKYAELKFSMLELESKIEINSNIKINDTLISGINENINLFIEDFVKIYSNKPIEIQNIKNIQISYIQKLKFLKDSPSEKINYALSRVKQESSALNFDIKQIISDLDNANSVENNEKKEVVILILIIIILTGFLIYIVKLNLSHILDPISKLILFSQKVANGDLTVSIDEERKDEYGKVYNSMNQMIIQMQNVIEGLNEGIDNFFSVSEQLNETSKIISQGANEQAAATEQISASMEQMISNIEQNSSNAQETEDIASKTVIDIDESNKKVQETATLMKEIAKRIDVISDIVFQTNLLSLNASIEASKAGDIGKGFAVVAQEVGTLAEKSKDAAKVIEKLIIKSLKISNDAGEMIEKLVPEIENTARLVLDIALASSEQNNGASQINVSIQQLSEVTQRNALSADLMATNSHELAVHSGMLKELIYFFKIPTIQK